MTEKRHLSRSFLVRMSPALADAIESAAARDRISGAAWLRRVAAEKALLESDEPDGPAGPTPLAGTAADQRRSPRRRARPVLVEGEADLRALVRDLGRLAGACVQLAKALRESRDPAHPAAEATLAEVRDAARKAVALVEAPPMSLLSGATRGQGGRALVRHLLKISQDQTVILAEARGLAGETLDDQIRELAAGAINTRTSRAIWHVHLDPVAWNVDVQVYFWMNLEAEFGLGEARYASVIHTKGGRTHEHRAYDVTRHDGSVVSLSYERMRREKVAVLTAHQCGLSMPPIPHTRAVRRALERDGRHDVAAWVGVS